MRTIEYTDSEGGKWVIKANLSHKDYVNACEYINVASMEIVANLDPKVLEAISGRVEQVQEGSEEKQQVTLEGMLTPTSPHRMVAMKFCVLNYNDKPFVYDGEGSEIDALVVREVSTHIIKEVTSRYFLVS